MHKIYVDGGKPWPPTIAVKTVLLALVSSEPVIVTVPFVAPASADVHVALGSNRIRRTVRVGSSDRPVIVNTEAASSGKKANGENEVVEPEKMRQE